MHMQNIINVHYNDNYKSVREVIHNAALVAARYKLLPFVVIRQCVYVTFYIKHHVTLPLINCSPDAALALLQMCLSASGLAA